MPYEREFAPRLGHVPAASSAAIQEAMTRWVIPAITADESEIEKRLIPLAKVAPDESRPAPKFTFAFDGSDVEIPAREKYPSVTVGFLKIGGALVDLDKFFNSDDRGLVDPRKLRQAMDARSIQSVLPGSMIVRPGMTGVQTWRLEVDEMFRTSGFTEAGETYSLRDALLTMHGEPGSPAAFIEIGKCPSCGMTDVPVVTDDAKCPACGIRLYVTDVLRTHDEFAESGSNMIPFTRVMNAAERLLSLGYMDWLYTHYPAALATTLFIQDGPLAFHGTTAPLKRRWLSYWAALAARLSEKGQLPPLLVGVRRAAPSLSMPRPSLSTFPSVTSWAWTTCTSRLASGSRTPARCTARTSSTGGGSFTRPPRGGCSSSPCPGCPKAIPTRTEARASCRTCTLTRSTTRR